MKILFCSFLFAISVFAQQPTEVSPISLNDLAVEAAGASHPVALTNKISAVLFTELKDEAGFSWQGFRVGGKEMMRDYAFRIDGMPLQRDESVRVLLYPDRFTRVYRNGVEETVTLFDSVNAFVVELKNVRGKSLTVYPLFSGAHNDSDYITGFDRNIMLIAQATHTARAAKGNRPVVIGLSLVDELYSAAGFYESAIIDNYFSPAYINTVKPDSLHRLIVATADSGEKAFTLVKLLAKNYDEIAGKQKERTERLINELLPPLADGTARFAFAWAIVGTDELILRDGTKNAFLDLPIAEGVDQRTEMLPVPGSGLVFGNKEKSRSYLQSLASLQDVDSSHDAYGQIMSRRIASSASLNITPWFALIIDQYFTMSNDTGFVKEMFPVIQRAINGTLKFHVDKNFQLNTAVIDEQLQTLSAFGLKKPHKTEAGVIQALWFKQLDAATELARSLGEHQTSEKWERILQKHFKISNKNK